MRSNTTSDDRLFFKNRSKLLSFLDEDEIVNRYRATFGVSRIGIEEAKAHARLEGELTDKVLRSTPEDRWQVFSDSYGRLFSELPWLNGETIAKEDKSFRTWARIVGKGKKVLEIGSGHGDLIRFLARLGNSCYATEITKERGEKFVPDSDGIVWEKTDGVNLSRFVPESSFDFVLSDQVFEHLHPDDHLIHLTEAYKVLSDQGQYVLRTPHRSTGPSDLSRVFGLDEPVFLHLWEPDYVYMASLMKQAGFKRLYAIYQNSRLGLVWKSRLYLEYQKVIDHIEAAVTKTQGQKRAFRKIAKLFFAYPAVWIIGEK